MWPHDIAADTDVNPIVVGVDGSYTAIRAARWAAAGAAQFDAPLRIVHAKPPLGHNPSDAIASLRASEMAAQWDASQFFRQLNMPSAPTFPPWSSPPPKSPHPPTRHWPS